MSENCDINACDCRPSWWQGMIKGFDSLSYPTGVVDRSGKWIILNKAALGFFGVDSVAALSAAASSALWGSRLRPPPGEGEADQDAPESVYLLDDRTEKVYQRQSSPLYDDAGELVGQVESIHDITNLYEADERVRVMIDAAPLCCNFWNDKFENIDCNLEAAKLFDLPDKKTYLRRFYELSPEKQAHPVSSGMSSSGRRFCR